MNASAAATVVGVVVAAATAAEPVLSATQGSMNSGDWTQLTTAVVMALFGWFTRFKSKGEPSP